MSELTKPLATYSHTRRGTDLVFVAGQGCRDPKTNNYVGVTRDMTGKVTAHDIEAQTTGVLRNIELALQQEGLDRRDIIDVQVFITTMADFPGMNKIWNQFFEGVTPPPTRTTVAVAALPGDNFVEMKTVAAQRAK